MNYTLRVCTLVPFIPVVQVALIDLPVILLAWRAQKEP